MDTSSLVVRRNSARSGQNRKPDMKKWLTCVFCLALAAMLGACNKSSLDPDQQPPMEVEGGMKVDLPALQAAVLQAPAPVQQAVSDATSKVRYKHYGEALMELDDALKQPDLNDKQKKLLAKVVEQLKEVVQKSGEQPK